uniref:2OG-Fe(II) oxygenase superfamily protein n=1 Tax=Pithovirus LCPAC304 TaxID=2506594 RepID=A0A481ZAC5_9VIRU|nr:MAG: 2OG-Fe(II) oxygenase superfamily protein [Pithovirus LCPAC304]
MQNKWIDDIDNKENRWVYKPLFPEKFSGAVIYYSPYIVKLKHFLSEKECGWLIEQAKDKYTRSTMWIDGKLAHDPRRTSQSAILTDNGCIKRPYNALLSNIIRRVCILTGCVPGQVEGLMVIKYEVGEEYQEHWDYFEEEDVGALNQRIATFFVYLNDMEPEDGGATVFPRLGLKCIPDRGSALFWWNKYGDQLLEDTKHCGAPVLKGTKYGLNVWIRYPGW